MNWMTGWLTVIVGLCAVVAFVLILFAAWPLLAVIFALLQG